MDDTQQSRASDAAATRKRRSSILKSQRPARTPFSELEFNVATPTDTAKSRRVSFSKRTGVAEFVTNEATTTWKNFYEEHNKSQDSTGNDSGANASRQPVEHLGKRIFDQQFEEVEAVDFIGTHNSLNANGSLNNVNFQDQLTSLECTASGKLTAPQNNFELSAFTDHQSKIFGNDFTVPCVSEMSGRIDVNFSAIQQVGSDRDDLDEIQRDLERNSNNMVCHGPFSDRQNMSEYIEVDLNMTHVAAKNDEDMSITDTVHSPVQNVSKSCSLDKKVSLNKDWVMDKENIAINPYAAPNEAANFAVTDEPDHVLVYDGKRLTLQSEKAEKEKPKDYRQTLLPNSSLETPQRKTIVLNMNDDLPNFADDILNSKCDNSGFGGARDLRSSTLYDDDKISMTLPVNRVDIVPKNKSIHDNTCNISMTQALPTNIMCDRLEMVMGPSDKTRTIVYEEGTGNISVTQALPAQIITSNGQLTERRRTVVYEDDTGNISITQAVPSNIFFNENTERNEKRKTIVFDDDKGNISVTQVLSSNIILDEKVDKRKTIVFDDDEGNISITQVVPADIVLSDRQLKEKRRTIIYEDDTGDISVTQALPTNVILPENEPKGAASERRRTVVYEDETGNISVTQALPSNIILDQNDYIYNNDENKPSTQSLPTEIVLKESDVNKRRTIIYEDATGNISITQAIPSQLLPGHSENKNNRSTVIDESIAVSMSLTNQPKGNTRRTICYDNDDYNEISMTQAIPTNIILSDEQSNKRKTIVFDNDDANISMTQAIATNVFLLDKLDSAVDQSIKIYQDDVSASEQSVKMSVANISMNQALPTDVLQLDKVDSPVSQSIKESQDNASALDQSVKMDEDNLEEEANENVTDYDNYEQCAPNADVVLERRNTVVFHADDCDAEMSITEAIPKVQNLIQESEKRNTIVFDNENGNISITKPIPVELIAFQTEILNKSKNKELDLLTEEVVTNPPESPDVIVYQTATTPHSDVNQQSNKVEQGDSKSARLNDSKSTSDAKVTSSSEVIVVPAVKDTPIYPEDSVQESLVSEDQSLQKHPPLEVKSDKINLKISSITINLESNVVESTGSEEDTATSTDPPIIEIDKPKDAVLNALLDMSTTSMESGTDDKNLMAQMDSFNNSADNVAKTDIDCTSSESMFYITRDSNDSVQTEKQLDKMKTIKSNETHSIENRSPLSIEYKEKTPELVNDLQKKLAELKTAVSEGNNTSTNRFYEKIVSPDLEGIVERDENVKLRQQSMTFRRANDTKELLEMISDFTDNKDDEDDEEPSQVKVKGLLALENKSEVNEPRRLSFAPNRQSIVLSREDLLTNISMAQAALQKSRLELDESDCLDEDTRDTTMDHNLSKKSGRMSNEVVKTLHFDDESVSESSLRIDSKSPLKKTAFGETSYMTESKAKVIPTFLKEVSDGIKELMSDLVKPIADTMPFDARVADKCEKKTPSTHSTQIQANLITSSQIDMDSELYSYAESGYDVEKINSGALRSRSFRSPVKFSTNSSEKSSEFEVPSPRQRYSYSRAPAEPSAPRVLVFDHLNPLNNILLGSMDYSDAHKYNPKKSDETLCGSDRGHADQIHDDRNAKDSDYDMEHVTKQYRIETRLTHAMQGDICSHKQDDEKSLESTISKPQSIDQSTDVKVMELKDTEVNTLIAMKGNKELLEASSSLTLVDDALDQPLSEVDVESRTSQSDAPASHRKVKISKSPVKIIYKIDEQVALTEKEDSVASNEREPDHAKKCTKSKKRIYSPCTDKYKTTQSPVDVTPKPTTKMQKLSNSPNVYRAVDLTETKEPTKITAEKDVTENREHITDQKKHTQNKSEKKKSPRKKECRPGTNITVQQLITEYSTDAGLNQNILDKQILKALNSKSETSTEPASQSDMLESNSLDVVSSFTSSKNLNAVKEVLSRSTTLSSPQSQPSTIQSRPSKIDWHPDLIHVMSSRNLCDSESGVNVVAKIDMLPFMGSHECEWESSSVDTWSFRLLHGRIRLTARLAHRHDNSTRSRVRGDTPVLDVNVETVQQDKKNPVATLCVRFACETMRYMVTKACRTTCYASDMPPLLRRCAAVARVALRWGRAMHDAKLHLAYTLDNDGYLTLKVANIPLRSVWEVSMRVELVVEDAREAPWPRAGAVRVARVVSDVPVRDAAVRRALLHTPRDWGHAPKTIWRMFRFLKHKTRDDDILLGA